jgi:segregation and condensation protein B
MSSTDLVLNESELVESASPALSLPDQIEALLFISDSPSKLSDLANTLAQPLGVIEQNLEVLERRYEMNGALKLVKIAGGYQIATKSQFAEIVARHLKPQKQRLSKSMLEVLAIIAYKQGITSSEIESIRGVQSDYGIRMLLERNLICESGRRQTPGRPIEYSTTTQFLHQFNLDHLGQLPDLELDALPQFAQSDSGRVQDGGSPK